MSVSFKSMQREGIVKRADARRMRWEDLHIEPGFNPEGRLDVDDEDNQSLLNYIMNGGYIPALEVRPREDGGAWIVEGHRRYTMIGVADKAGAPLRDKEGELWIDIVPFEGNDVDRHYRVVESAEQKVLTPLQLAEQFAKLARFKQTPSQIAERLKPKRTRQHVEQMLILASANHDVKEMVKAGLAAAVAIDAVRKHGENAGAFLAATMQATGKAKITAKDIKPWTPPARYCAPLLSNAEAVIRSLPPEIVKQAHDGFAADPAGNVVITVSASALARLVGNVEGIAGIREAAEQKARDKAAKAAQVNIAGA